MPLADIFPGLGISASGMRAQRITQNVIASNLANAETTRTAEGGPYRRQRVLLEADPRENERRFVFGPARLEGDLTQGGHMKIPESKMGLSKDFVGAGVSVTAIDKDPSEFRTVFDPNHPDADTDGYVQLPNVNVVQEMTDMITATRAYEANATAFNSTKSMLMKALEL
jgi:flagellar basal-body rod protein FlgC